MTSTASSTALRTRPQASPDPVPLLLKEAADTLRRLPRGVTKPRLSSWPEVVRDSVAMLSASDTAGRRPSPPSPQTIDRMDRTLVWLLSCDEEARRLVWARATGISWRRLEDMDGRSHVTLRKIVARGHDQIRALLAADDKKKAINMKKPLYTI